MREHRPARRADRRSGADAPALDIAAEWTGLCPTITGDALLEVLAESGCPLCLLAGPAVDALVERVLLVQRLPELTERQLRPAQGFYGPDAWRLAAGAAAQRLPAEAVSRALGRVLADARASMAYYGEDDAKAHLEPTIFKRALAGQLHGLYELLGPRPDLRIPYWLYLCQCDSGVGR